VLNWNSLPHLQRCLDALRRQSLRDFELVIIDNGSTDDSPAWLAARDLSALVGAPARLVALPDNTGFAAGMNAGLRRARGHWLLPLNVDVVLAENFLEQAAACAISHPQAGMLGALVYQYDSAPTDTVIATAMRLTPWLSVATDTAAWQVERETFGPAGCCPLFARAALETVRLDPTLTRSRKVEYYDERYFAYGEDVDLFLRMHLLGVRCVYSPRLRAWHVHAATQRGIRWWEKDHATLARLPANAFHSWLKNCPGAMLARLAPRVLCAAPAMALALLVRRPRACLHPLRALGAIVREFPRDLRMRRRLQNGRTASSGALMRWMEDA
jgi:GT2 family glycosyltransferase